MARGLWFVGGVIFGIFLTSAACTQGPAYSSGPSGPPAAVTSYYGPPPGPPPGSRPAISQAINDLQHARYVLEAKAENDYHGHKANAVGYIDNALGELQLCQSIP